MAEQSATDAAAGRSAAETDNPHLDLESDEEDDSWMRGTVMRVLAGASQVKWVLEDGMHQLVVIEWFASWIEPCKEAVAEVDRMVRRYPDVAFLRLDVHDSSGNTAFAMEKVLTTPEARRQGARPVLRDAARWPCFTLHDYTLQPLRQLTGAAALAELEAAVREHSAGPVQLTAAQEAELVKRQEAHWAAGNLPGGYDDDDDDGNAPDGAAAPAPQPQPAVNVRAISNGAADLKALLADARAADTAALVLWTDSAASAAADGGGASNRADTGVTAAASGSEAAGSEAAAGDAAGGAPARAAGAAAGSSSDDSAASADVPNVLGAAVAALDEPTALAGHIDIAASRANRVLAGALKVTAPPVCHVYRNMKLVGEAAAGAPDELAAALAGLRITPADATAAAPVSGAGDTAGASGAAAASPVTAPPLPATVAHEPSVWDPPEGKFNRPGTVRQFDQGMAHLYPKMPCLRCGCNRWLGEDWDARCARCSWTCETQGYDNESRPLPRFRARKVGCAVRQHS